MTQVVVGPPESNADQIDEAGRVPSESVILIKGTVTNRLEGKVNDKLSTGEIEVRTVHFEVLNVCVAQKLQISEFLIKLFFRLDPGQFGDLPRLQFQPQQPQYVIKF